MQKWKNQKNQTQGKWYYSGLIFLFMQNFDLYSIFIILKQTNVFFKKNIHLLENYKYWVPSKILHKQKNQMQAISFTLRLIFLFFLFLHFLCKNNLLSEHGHMSFLKGVFVNFITHKLQIFLQHILWEKCSKFDFTQLCNSMSVQNIASFSGC